MKATVLFTGGKDSHYALYWALHQGFNVAVLSSIIPKYEYSMLYHRPRLEVLGAQSRCLGIGLEYEVVEDPGHELDALYRLLRRVKEEYGVKAVFSGAILSDFQRIRFSIVAERLGLRTYTPLWRIDQVRYMRDLIETGFELLIVSVNTMGLPLDLVGKTLNRRDVELIIRKAVKYGFNPAFEGGEAETLVTYMPHYRDRLRLSGRVRVLGEYEAIYEIESVAGC